MDHKLPYKGTLTEAQKKAGKKAFDRELAAVRKETDDSEEITRRARDAAFSVIASKKGYGGQEIDDFVDSLSP